MSSLEEQMMNNDSICCNNGHRDNILGSLHNRVSLGISYNSTTVFLVEDLNYYINLNYTVSSSNDVRILGTELSQISISQVEIFYDSSPVAETVAQLSADPHSYDGGAFTEVSFLHAFLPAITIQNAVNIQAESWQVSGSNVIIEFSLAKFIGAYGAGVYTIHITGPDRQDDYTSISIFNSRLNEFA